MIVFLQKFVFSLRRLVCYRLWIETGLLTTLLLGHISNPLDLESLLLDPEIFTENINRQLVR